jgi:hypothetical protein
MTAKKFPGQLPTDCGPLPQLLYSVDEVAAMFGKAPSTIRAACWEHGLPYRLETTWGPRRSALPPDGLQYARDLGAARPLRAARQPGARRRGRLPSVAAEHGGLASLARQWT